MKYFLRPYTHLGLFALLGAGVALMPHAALAQGTGIMQVVEEEPLLLHTSTSQGYLGVDFVDVDQDKAQALKLKDVRGAVITLIDHDAPAGQIGLHVNDVVIQLNGQNVEGAEQLKRMLKEIPPGHKVSIEISRDGNVQTMAVELVDHKVLGHDVWNKIGNGGDVFAGGSGLGILAGAGDGSLPGVFRMPIFGSTLNVGAMVEPLTTQMAEYLGVQSGLMVKQVARKSDAATAGLKAFDVILKVGPDAVTNVSGWDRALRSNQGKTVQVTILRDRKQQTLTLLVDSKHRTSELEFENVYPDDEAIVIAEVDPDLAQIFGGQAAADAEAMRKQAEALEEQLKGSGLERLQASPQQALELQKQAEKMRGSLNDFKIDPRQMEEMNRQMEEFRKNFKAEDFNGFTVDPKQMEELKRQMEEWQRNFEPQELQVAPY